ncbi:hypothetical protein ACFY9C_15300 [Streptomyces filamentosus]|uniref:hypothetical protein n=1 Tax=Streptomyces filamentosus TaxID=67294 RepID=UPI0036E89DCD
MRRRKQPVLVAVALCLGGALTACGGGDGGGFTAVGAGPSPGGAVGPSGAVELVPLETPTASGTISSTSSPPPKPPGAPGTPGAPSGSPGHTTGPSSPHPTGSGAGADSGAGSDSGTDPGAGSGTGAGSGAGPGTGSGSGGRTETAGAPGDGGPSSGATATPVPTRTARPTVTPAPTPSAPRPGTETPAPGPAAVAVSAFDTADGDKRWCERVTVTFRNTGGSPATSGTVSFGTHVIGLLGLDWATVTTSRPLPAPIAAGASRKQTYTVCLEEWRVPLGMRVDTREVTVSLR